VKNKKTDPLFLKLFDLEPSRRDLRKIEIVLAAIDCIAEVGLELTTFENIAKRLKTGPSHVAYYFPNKTEIIEAAIKFSLGTAQDITVRNVQKVSSKKEKLEVIVRSTFEWGRTYPKHALVFLLFQYLGAIDEKRKALHSEIRKVGRDRIVQVLESHEKSTSMSKIKTKRVAHEIQNMTLGNLFESISIDSPYSLKEHEDATVKAVFELVRGWF